MLHSLFRFRLERELLEHSVLLSRSLPAVSTGDPRLPSVHEKGFMLAVMLWVTQRHIPLSSAPKVCLVHWGVWTVIQEMSVQGPASGVADEGHQCVEQGGHLAGSGGAQDKGGGSKPGCLLLLPVTGTQMG